MGFETPKMPSPEEMAEIEKARILSDAELLKEGAEYKFDEIGQKSFELSTEQIERARKEMEQELSKKESKEEVNYIETEKGSVYIYLPDGRTQRYKKVENKHYEPQDALVFIPDWSWVSKNAPDNILAKIGENELQYEQSMLEHRDMKGGKIYIVDKKGNKLETNQAIKETEGPVFLWFGHTETTGEKDKLIQDFAIPVSSEAKKGYYTFDTRKYKTEEGTKREVHIGNKVKEIMYK